MLPGHEIMVTGVAIGEVSGQPVIVSIDHAGRLFRWEMRSGECLDTGLPPLRVGKDHGDHRVATAQVYGRSMLLAAGEKGRKIRCWDLATREEQPSLGGHRQPVTCITAGVLPGRKVVVSGDRAGVVHVWDTGSRSNSRARTH